jgi:hypothetical protein
MLMVLLHSREEKADHCPPWSKMLVAGGWSRADLAGHMRCFPQRTSNFPGRSTVDILIRLEHWHVGDVEVPYQDIHSSASTSNVLKRDRTFQLRMDLQEYTASMTKLQPLSERDWNKIPTIANSFPDLNSIWDIEALHLAHFPLSITHSI